METTDALRRSAPEWSLAGDQQLLAALQDLHQRIISKCTETNSKLNEMTTSLDDAGVSLQNINNKFTALSNSQFIESRVYDDDSELVNEVEKPVEKPEPKPSGPDIDSIRRSLQVLERMHESVTIVCDSDSDSEDDEDAVRVVLKPKDLYADRPLPHIIGSQAWKNKWHAGLLIDESESDDNDSKPGARDSEQYSESESEGFEFGRDLPSHSTALEGGQRERTISPSSSEVSHNNIPPAAPPAPPAPTPAAVAAELARRLAGDQPMPSQPVEYSPPEPAVRKVYKPERPAPGNIFPDEPPPLEMDQSEESDDDIFAQINKSQPYNKSSKDQNSIAEDLFGTPIFDEVDQKVPPAKQKSTLFEGDSEPELFAENKPQVAKKDDTGTKKPVGGMSLFGTNKNAENIGAAILKRNQRQPSTSGDESDEPRPQIKQNKPQIKNNDVIEPTQIPKQVPNENKSKNNVERDIFDDLFARSEKINKGKEPTMLKDKNDDKNSANSLAKEKEPQKKVDVFADNLFDDIDDIFTTDIKAVKVNDSNKAKPKSIFDDDDDLFSDLAVTNKVKENKNTSINKAKSIFDSDEDLFNAKADDIKTNKEPKDEQMSPKPNKTEVNKRVNEIVKNSKGLFDDSDDELFTNTKTNKSNTNNANVDLGKNTQINADKVKLAKENKDNLIDKEDDLFKTETVESKVEHSLKPNLDILKDKMGLEKGIKPNVINSPNLFEDEDDDDLFKTETLDKTTIKSKDDKVTSEQDKTHDYDNFISNDNLDLKTNNNIGENNKISRLREGKTVDEKKEISIFRDDPEEDIFSKPKSETETPKQDVLDNILPQNSPNVFEEQEYEDNENTTEVDRTSETVDTTVITKPDISRKPVMARKNERISVEILRTTKIETLDNAVVENVPDNKQVVDSNSNITEGFTGTNSEREVKQKDLNQATTDKLTASHFDELENKHSNKSSYSNKEEPKSEAKDIFSDIFNDQPPIFEKPKEPKKSKNINALFDDDSDDEALFLRKTEVVDEKPASFPNTNDDRLFGIFRDEPPDIDVDELFIDKNTDKIKPKTNDGDENLVKNVSTFSNEPSDFDINFATQPIPKANVDFVDNKLKKDVFSDVTEDIFKKPTSLFEDEDQNAQKTDTGNIVSSQKEISQTDTEKSVKPESDKTDGVQESKKVGKLKPMNLNINVNSLLPGASPKKVSKPVEQTDGQIISKSNEELPIEKTSEDFDPKLVKSVSFEGKPDSPILDNKLSKERAKIQVKRRPSTRRARREAVKKSGIDFGEDTTDNNSIEQSNPPDLINNSAITNDENENITDSAKNEPKHDDGITKDNDTQSTSSNIEQDVTVTKENEVSNTTKDVKSKVVYILNDEDIFNLPTRTETKAATKKLEIVDDFDNTDKRNEQNIETDTESPISTLGKVYNAPKDFKKDFSTVESDDEILFKQTSSIVKVIKTDPTQTDSDEDLFKAIPNTKSKKMDNNLQETKQSNVKKETNDIFSKPEPKSQVPKPVKSLFDDLDDEALFSANKKPTKTTDKLKIFDSDSDDDLFGKKSQKKEVKSLDREGKEVKSLEREVKEVKRVEVKGSLFGDDDDSDDLFGAKTKKNIGLPQSSKSKATSSTKEVPSKKAEPVSVDPLSLFGDEED